MADSNYQKVQGMISFREQKQQLEFELNAVHAFLRSEEDIQEAEDAVTGDE